MMLRELLTTRGELEQPHPPPVNTLLRGHGDESREKTDRAIDKLPEVHPLDALRANSELVRLLFGWQWQAVYDARWREHTWPQIAGRPRRHRRPGARRLWQVIDRQERLLGRDVDLYPAVLWPTGC